MARRTNEFLSTEVMITHDHASLTATTSVDIFKADRKMRVLRARYNNPTGLAQNANAFAITLSKTGSAVVASGIDSASAAIPAGTFPALTVAAGAASILNPGDVLSFVATETGTATLPAGRLQVELAYV